MCPVFPHRHPPSLFESATGFEWTIPFISTILLEGMLIFTSKLGENVYFQQTITSQGFRVGED